MARKQKDLPGMERQVNAEVEAAAEAYVASRTKRIKLLGNEVADKLALIAAMQKAKVDVYKDEEHGLIITITPGKLGVKVQEASEAEDDDGESEAA